MSVVDQLQALLERHCASLDGEIGSIGRKLSAITLATGQCPEILQETIALVHTVNGSSGSLGFRTLSTAAAKLEDVLNDIARSKEPPTEPDIWQANDLFSEMQTIANATTPEDSNLFGVDLAKPGQDSGARSKSA